MSDPERTRPRVAVVGSINMDLVAHTSSLPLPGETVLGSSFTASAGGKGANQAIAAVRSGAAVTFLGAVGADAYALELREVLVAADIDASLLREAEGPSGVAVITVDADAENSIVVVAGANDALVDLTEAEKAVIGAADVLLCQLEIPIDTVTAAARHARQQGVTVFLNPSPVRQLPAELLDAVDVLVVNRAERDALNSSALERIPHLVTTLGADGALYSGPDAAEIRVAAATVDAVDTTGAGDAFTGALAASWTDGPEAAVRRACIAGALATTRRGAGESAPTASEIDALAAVRG